MPDQNPDDNLKMQMPMHPSTKPHQPAVWLDHRTSILQWLQWNDKNGCYTDDHSAADEMESLTLHEARLLYAQVACCADNPDDVECYETLTKMLRGKFEWEGNKYVGISAVHFYVQHSGVSWRITFIAKPDHKDVGDWACYMIPTIERVIFADSGASIKDAINICLTDGLKMPEEIARAIFPTWKGPYRK